MVDFVAETEKALITGLAPFVETELASVARKINKSWVQLVNQGRDSKECLHPPVSWDVSKLLRAVEECWPHLWPAFEKQSQNRGIVSPELKSRIVLLRKLRNRKSHLGATTFTEDDRDDFLYQSERLLRSASAVQQADQISKLRAILRNDAAKSEELARLSDSAKSYVDTLISHYERFDEFKSRAIIDLLGRSDLYKYYVGLNARDIGGDRPAAIADIVEGWLHDKDRNHLTILGDFGSGKSSYCLHLVYELAKRYRNDSVVNRIPIFVQLSSLRDFTDIADFRDRLMRIITRYGLNLPSFESFQNSLAAGKFLLVFDGFDEMTAGGDRPRTRKNLEALNQFLSGNAKLILTCRTHYFTTQKEITSALSTANDTELMRSFRGQLNSTVVILEDLNDEQIIEYLRKHTADWKILLDKIRGTYDLKDLAKRPLLLSMIVETASALIGRLTVNAADLYDAYTRIWIEHEDGRSVMSPAVKAKVMQELAFAMFSQDEKQSIHFKELLRPIREHLRDKVARGTDDVLEHDVRTCSFLNRDQAGYYRFIHKSFMEFFVAQKLSDELVGKNYADFARERISPEMADFMVALLERTEGVARDSLFALIDETMDKKFTMVRYRGTNALMILRPSGDKDQFAGKDFSRTVLREADFQDVDLTKTNFSEADLGHSSFNHSILAECDFRGANLEDVALGENNAIVGFDARVKDDNLALGMSSGEIKIYSSRDRAFEASLRGHVNSVKAVAFSADGGYLASGGIDGSVRIWDVSSLEEVMRLRGHRRGVRAIAFSPKGDRVASGSYDSTVRIWTIDLRGRTGREEYCLESHQGPVYSVAIEPGGERLASSSGDGTVRIWNVDTGAEVSSVTLSGQADAVAYSHDGTLIAAGDGQECVRVWNVVDFEEVASYSLHSALIFSVCFSPDGSYVASGDQAGRIVVWSVKEGGLWFQIPTAHKGVVNGLRFVSKCDQLASVSEDGTLKLWDILNRRLDPISTEGVADDLHVSGMRIGGAMGLSEARVSFLKRKGAVD